MPALSGRTALVTGGAVRIGRAAALALAAAGANVVVHYHTSREPAESVSAEARSLGVASTTVQADLANPLTAAAVLRDAIDLTGTLDILVNSAASYNESTFESLEFNALLREIELNALSPLELSRAFAAHVRGRKGSDGSGPRRPVIVNLLDARITDFDREHIGYALSKRMLFSLTRMMAIHYAPDLRVNAVAPGLVLPPPGMDDGFLEERRTNNPLHVISNVDQVADAIVFLASSEYATGQIIYVDGGRHIKGSVFGS